MGDESAVTGAAMAGVHEWYGIRSQSDLVVSLLPSFTDFATTAARSASIAGRSDGNGRGGTREEEDSRSRKRKSAEQSDGDGRGGTREVEDSRSRKRKSAEQSDGDGRGGTREVEDSRSQKRTLAELHVHSKRVRGCSRYFDTCMSERWTNAGHSKGAMRLALEVHTDVKYYKECFARMYSPFLEIPGVVHCLELVQVASQIEFQELVEICVNYLAAMPWSPDDERRIRKFAESSHYPVDCATDLSARLGLRLSGTERHGSLLDLTETVLCVYHHYCSRSPFEYEEGVSSSSRSLFRDTFVQIMGGSSQALAERALRFFNNVVKQKISYVEKEEDPHMLDMDALGHVRWSLRLLLDTRTAKEVVEYIVEESSLDDTLSRRHSDFPLEEEWTDIFLCILKEVVEGRLWLKTSTRLKLIEKYTWILTLGSEFGREESVKILCTFVTTFSYKQQKKILFDEIFLFKPHKDSRWKLYKLWLSTLQESITAVEHGAGSTPEW